MSVDVQPRRFMLPDENGWLFSKTGESPNEIHDLSAGDLEDLFHLAEIEDRWAEAVRQEVVRHEGDTGEPWVVNHIRIQNTSGTVISYPFGDAITFMSRRHLFRGECGQFENSWPSLNRRLIKDFPSGGDPSCAVASRELYRSVANMRIWQFAKFLWTLHVVPYWEATMSDVNFKALAQHYGFDTSLLDLTNDVRVALFFATCKYDYESDSYRPLTEDDIEQDPKLRFGMLFHTPDWEADYLNGGSVTIADRLERLGADKPLGVDSEELDGVAFQIGYQPFYRCGIQSGYIMPMRDCLPLQEDQRFEKMRFRQSPGFSRRVFELMDGGERVFPSEGISAALSTLRSIQRSVTFSEDDVSLVYENDEVDRALFPTFEDFRAAIGSFRVGGRWVRIVPDEVSYSLDASARDYINEMYDGKNLCAAVGGMIHMTGPQEKFRRERCKEIYGIYPEEA